MSITGKQLAEFAVKCFLDGVRYWYGTCYYKCTTALLNSKTRQYPAHYTSGRRMRNSCSLPGRMTRTTWATA